MDKIRVSLGTAAILGLTPCKLDAVPTTAYLMTYIPRKCYANCAFCPQARESQTKTEFLSRIQWPLFSLKDVLKGFSNKQPKNTFKRICIQSLNYPELFQDLKHVITQLRNSQNLPISLSIPPLKKNQLKKLQDLGVNRIGIALDAATPEIFSKIKGIQNKGPYKWETHLETIKEALKIYGPYNVTSHLIIGLGETEFEAISFFQNLFDLEVSTGLFAFTPIKGTILENKLQPTLENYRKIQLARYLIINKLVRIDDFEFDEEGNITDFGIDSNKLFEIIQSGLPFLTSGCPNCNRPYYNERPGQELYNFPRPLSAHELPNIEKIFRAILERKENHG
ncbi:MAG: radical SAM protein [Candidatus Hodarchaeota archaeon]